MKQSIGYRKTRPRRHGLKLPGGYRCKCCFVPEEGKAKEREICRAEILDQLAEVPDSVRVFDDFRELPDDIFDSHGDFWPCQCEYCSRTWNEDGEALTPCEP